MAKQNNEQMESSIWDDFTDENLLSVDDSTNEDEVQQEVEEKEEEEEEVTEKVEKKVSKKQPKKVEKEIEEEKVEEVKEEKVSKSVTESVKEEDQQDDPQVFFEEVEKITGQGVEVDYGDVDPLTPQGIAIREKAVREAALETFLEEIETNHPAAFKALQHAYNGGDIAELFKTVTARDYSKVQLTENDVELGKEILKEYYQSKGIKNEKRIQKLLETAEDSEEGLIIEAQSALDELKAAQAEETDRTLKEQQLKAEEQKKRDRLTVSAIDEVLESGKLGSFKLTGRAEAQEFKKFALNGLRRTADGKGYEFATPIDSANLEKLLQYQYFQFKKGDLSKLIQIKASTENAQKLKLKLNAEAARGKTSSSSDRGDNVSQTLNDYYV
jgi:hypothetical protein